MATAVEAARDEIRETLARIEPEHEGLYDFARLNITPETKAVVDAAIADYDRRVAKLRSTLVEIEGLLADGYPALDVREVAGTVYNDLQAQNATIDAALAKFQPAVAANMGLAAGTPEPKASGVSP